MSKSTIQFTELHKSELDNCVTKFKRELLSKIEDDEFGGSTEDFKTLFESVLQFDTLSYTLSKSKSKKTTRNKKDPNAPKKPKTAYFIWAWNQDPDVGVSKIKQEFPDLKHSQHLSEAGKIWKSMSTQDKQIYIDLSQKAKIQYKLDIQKYKSTQPEQPEQLEQHKEMKEVVMEVVEEVVMEVVEEVVMEEVVREEEVEGEENVDFEYDRRVGYTLYGYTKNTGKKGYDSLSEVYEQYKNDDEANGIVFDNDKYYIKKGQKLTKKNGFTVYLIK